MLGMLSVDWMESLTWVENFALRLLMECLVLGKADGAHQMNEDVLLILMIAVTTVARVVITPMTVRYIVAVPTEGLAQDLEAVDVVQEAVRITTEGANRILALHVEAILNLHVEAIPVHDPVLLGEAQVALPEEAQASHGADRVLAAGSGQLVHNDEAAPVVTPSLVRLASSNE